MDDVMAMPEHQTPELRRKNLRLVWLLIAFALFIFFTSFPFWSGLFRLIGDQGMG
jgi:F0F1-type ATP synthase membrane subunit b/b'